MAYAWPSVSAGGKVVLVTGGVEPSGAAGGGQGIGRGTVEVAHPFQRDDRIARLHTVRNRVGHHEPVHTVNLAGRLKDITDLANLIDPNLGAYITATTKIPQALSSRP